MTEQTVLAPVIRQAGEGEARWFFGGGEMTWKVRAADSGGAFLLLEVVLEQGKVTPLHTHPTDESWYILEGELLMHLDGAETRVAAGGFVLAPRGVPHAFMVLSERCRVLSLQVPGNCEAFYFGASEPLEGSARQTDFDKIGQSAERNGGITLVGPPPFGPLG